MKYDHHCMRPFLTAVLFVAAGFAFQFQTSSAQEMPVNTEEAEILAFDVMPVPGETYRIAAKSSWSMTPGYYKKNRM